MNTIEFSFRQDWFCWHLMYIRLCNNTTCFGLKKSFSSRYRLWVIIIIVVIVVVVVVVVVTSVPYCWHQTDQEFASHHIYDISEILECHKNCSLCSVIFINHWIDTTEQYVKMLLYLYPFLEHVSKMVRRHVVLITQLCVHKVLIRAALFEMASNYIHFMCINTAECNWNLSGKI